MERLNAMNMGRRQFPSRVSSTSGLAWLGSVANLKAAQRPVGANDRIRVAVCGVHKRGCVELVPNCVRDRPVVLRYSFTA